MKDLCLIYKFNMLEALITVSFKALTFVNSAS